MHAYASMHIRSIIITSPIFLCLRCMNGYPESQPALYLHSKTLKMHNGMLMMWALHKNRLIETLVKLPIIDQEISNHSSQRLLTILFLSRHSIPLRIMDRETYRQTAMYRSNNQCITFQLFQNMLILMILQTIFPKHMPNSPPSLHT